MGFQNWSIIASKRFFEWAKWVLFPHVIRFEHLKFSRLFYSLFQTVFIWLTPFDWTFDGFCLFFWFKLSSFHFTSIILFRRFICLSPFFIFLPGISKLRCIKVIIYYDFFLIYIRSCTEISLLLAMTCFTSGKNCFSSIATNADVSLIHITRTWPQ